MGQISGVRRETLDLMMTGVTNGGHDADPQMDPNCFRANHQRMMNLKLTDVTKNQQPTLGVGGVPSV